MQQQAKIRLVEFRLGTSVQVYGEAQCLGDP